ncbi:hypothetical protein PIB30_040668 [Stylosanthes scabra]|uniref:TF-B3 domain-containing protein n=1 Tax=Stylosanthes scabra TaxID=79078 RepID=A0ABU6ZDF1_9FABA|nr:hypothetical protein [Stylosanthes scabra]
MSFREFPEYQGLMFRPEPSNVIVIDIIPYKEYYCLPDEFFRTFKNNLPFCVMFVDSDGNQFEVFIIVVMDSAFIIDGIEDIMAQYHLDYGTRITASYCGMEYFGFQVSNMLFKPDPVFSPTAYISPDAEKSTSQMYRSVFLTDDNQHIYIEWLITQYQFTESILSALPNIPEKVTIIGSQNTKHTVRLAFKPCRPNEFYLGRDWRKFLRENKLQAGDIIRLSSSLQYPGILHCSRVIPE